MPAISRRRRALWIIPIAVTVLSGVLAATRYRANDGASRPAPHALVASIRSDPQSFNRYAARDFSTTVLTYLMHGALVRVNRVTNQLEPELAEGWTRLPDQRTYRLRLRRGVRFSDGTPFTADDVAFSFRAIYDTATPSVLADSLQVDGRPLAIAADDAFTVTIRFPAPFGPGLRILDGVPIYPRQRLAAALERGAFRKAWGTSTPPEAIAGLGPFVLRRYEPGQRLTLERNPFYWRAGLPKLDRIVLEILPDQAAESLRLQTGDIDLTQGEVRPADARGLQRAAAAGRLTVKDSGVGLDGDLFWMNLTAAKSRDPRSRWLQQTDFRRAIAHAVDRRAFADVVYLGAAVPADGIVSPGNSEWHAATPLPGYDPDAARRLLSGLRLTDRDGDGFLEDQSGAPVRFTLLTQSGNTSLERGASLIRESLSRIGIRVDVVSVEASALIDFVMRGEYDAAYFRLLTTDTDPALNADFWLSSGGAHVWNPAQPTPATAWERRVDALITSMATEVDATRRAALFAEVQHIVGRELPVLCFAFPRVAVAVSTRVVDATPAPFRPPVLWNPAVIDVR
jgi:peptide/nickel transport system substrate-binding protein